MKTQIKNSGKELQILSNFCSSETLYRNFDEKIADIRWQILISPLFKSKQKMNNILHLIALTSMALKCFISTSLNTIQYFPKFWNCIFICTLVSFALDVFTICNIYAISKCWRPLIFTYIKITWEWICVIAVVILATEWTDWLIFLGTPISLPNIYKTLIKNIILISLAYLSISLMSKFATTNFICWIFKDSVQCLDYEDDDILWASTGRGKHLCLKYYVADETQKDTKKNSSFHMIVNSAVKQAGCHVSLVSLHKLLRLRCTEVCGLPAVQWRNVNDVLQPLTHQVFGSEPVVLCVGGIGERLHRDIARLTDPSIPLAELEGQMFIFVKPDILLWTNPADGITEAMKFLQNKFF